MKQKKLIAMGIILCLISITLSVYAENINVQGISLNKNNISLEIGQADKIIAIINPGNATNQQVRWSSSNSNIATVTAAGNIRGISQGVATITATSVDRGYTASAYVNVSGVSSLTSDKYVKISDKNSLGENVTYLTKIVPGTSVSKFKQNIVTYSNLTIYDLSNVVVKDSDIVATGMKLKLSDNSEYFLSVITDVTSDGKLSVVDLSRLKARMIGLTTLDDAQAKAADSNNDGKISIVDLSIMKQYLIGLIRW